MVNGKLAVYPSVLGLSMRPQKKSTTAFKVELGYIFPRTTQEGEKEEAICS